jgi:hypothetical protein
VADWKEEVRVLFADASPTPGSRSRTPQSQQNPNPNKVVNLKKVESLLEAGETFPFAVEAELELLRDRRIQAKAWLEKLKKSFQTKTGGRVGASRRGGSTEGAVNTADRLNLSDMKMMVEEGAQMFEDEDSEERSRATAQVRELSRAQSVVEIAEEWLARIRDLINSDVDDKGNINQGDVTPGEEGEDGINADEPVNLRELLREMLKEAEGMPVHMEEVQILRVHLQVLDWAEKMRSILPVPASFTVALTEAARSNHSPFEMPARIPVSAISLPETSGTDTVKPAFTKVVELCNEVKKLRSQIPPSAESFSIRLIPEEAYCLQTVSAVEQWIQQVKRQLMVTTLIGFPYHYP